MESLCAAAATKRSALGLCVVLVLVLACCLMTASDNSCANASAPSGFKLSKLFDFDHYRQTFRKQYGSQAVTLSRKCLYMASALRAYVSGVQYKFWKREDYKAVNHLSDLSADEIKLMKNKLPAEGEASEGGKASGNGNEDGTSDTNLPELLPDKDEDIEQELVKLIEEHPNEREYADLREHLAAADKQQRRRRRKKRQVDDSPASPPTHPVPRELPMSKLINEGAADSGNATPSLKHRRVTYNLKSNNANYKGFDVLSYGLLDQQELVKVWQVPRKDKRPIGEQLASSLFGLESKLSPSERSSLPDEVFVDHRKSGCFLEPRFQDLCGSCYAFASIALMEWTLCKKTGSLTPLSEQYMIDCGKGRFGNLLNGCEYGQPLGAVNFIHNFGLETQRNYHYTGQEGQCPYAPDFDLTKTGFYRLPLGNSIAISWEHWDKYIEHGPMYVQAKTGHGFEEYGGGIDMGLECVSETNHAMLLIGHGRQNGLQYWLLRNSYSTKWGEQGYWKLYKGATEKCLYQYGHAYGTKDGINYEIKVQTLEKRS